MSLSAAPLDEAELQTQIQSIVDSIKVIIEIQSGTLEQRYIGTKTATEQIMSLYQRYAEQKVEAARKEFFDNQYDINDAWELYHGGMTYPEFAEDYLAHLTNPQRKNK